MLILRLENASSTIRRGWFSAVTGCLSSPCSLLAALCCSRLLLPNFHTFGGSFFGSRLALFRCHRFRCLLTAAASTNFPARPAGVTEKFQGLIWQLVLFHINSLHPLRCFTLKTFLAFLLTGGVS